MCIVCPGYRDPLDELFRDESAAVTRRAQRRDKTPTDATEDHPARGISSRSITNFEQESHVPSLGTNQLISSVAPELSLPQSIDDIALSYFMTTYVPGSHFVYLPQLYKLSTVCEALPSTVHAVSLARLSWETQQPGLMQQAKHAYAKALAQTNSALSNPLTATSDAVLVSVLLLSLYETIVWADAGTPDNWIKHTRGALALIQLRGKQQLDTEVGRLLFTQVANIISVDSMRTGARLSPVLLELQDASLEYSAECPRFTMSRSTGELAVLLADLSEGRLTPEEVIEGTQQLEAKYIAFASSLPSFWQYVEEPSDVAHVDVYSSTRHRYPDNRTAQFWNSYRMARIFLNGIMHGHARYLRTPENSQLLAQAEHNVKQMAAEICASVPQFTDPRNFTLSAAATLLWPLSTVRSADLVDQGLRGYAEERLKFLGRKLHIPQAEKVAGSREVDALHDGLHMFYLN